MAVFTPPGSGNDGEVVHDRSPSPAMLRSSLSSLGLSAVSLLLGFVSVPVMIGGLGYAGYAVYSLAFTIAGYGALLDLGFGWAGTRFTADAHAAGDRDAVAGVLWALVLYQALVGAVVLLALTAGAEPLGAWLMVGSGDAGLRMARVLPLAALWFALSNLTGIFVGVLRGLQRFGAAALVAGTALVIGVGGGALAVATGRGLRVAVACQVLGALVAAVLAVGALRGLLLPTPPGHLIVASGRQLRRMLSFSLWSLVSRLVQLVVLQGDKVVVARAGGAVELASYVVAFNAAQKLNVLGSAAVTAIYPVAAVQRGELEAFRESYFGTARAVHLLTAAPAITLLALAPLFLASWIGPDMASSGAGILRALALGYWIVSVGSVEAGCLEGWGLPRVTALIAVGSAAAAGLIGVLLLVTQGSRWAVAGAVAAWMAASGLANTIAWHRVSGFPARRFWRELGRPIAEMALLGLVIGEVMTRWVAPGPAGLLACALLAALLLGYGFLRLVPGHERKRWRNRLAGLAGA